MVRSPKPKSRDAVDAEAAAWVARLHSDRKGSTEAAVNAWRDEDPEHREAFARATEIWDMLPGAVVTGPAEPWLEQPRLRFAIPVRLAPMVAALAALLLTVAIGTALVWTKREPAYLYRTGPANQQQLLMSDGTRISLNADSAVAVNYEAHRRSVVLERGEALFEVAKDPSKPFVVTVDGKQVLALGTTFVVQRTAKLVAVTLVEGRVEVKRGAESDGFGKVVLTPGDRLRITSASALVDRPPLRAILAWRDGRIDFDDVSLGEAAAELNRYAVSNRIEMDERVAALRISGVFSNNPVDFANTVAELYGLRVDRNGRTISLVRAMSTTSSGDR